jgi:hypothetical protein
MGLGYPVLGLGLGWVIEVGPKLGFGEAYT